MSMEPSRTCQLRKILQISCFSGKLSEDSISFPLTIERSDDFQVIVESFEVHSKSHLIISKDWYKDMIVGLSNFYRAGSF